MSATAKSLIIDLDMVAVGCDMHRGVIDLARDMLATQAARIAALEARLERSGDMASLLRIEMEVLGGNECESPTHVADDVIDRVRDLRIDNLRIAKLEAEVERLVDSDSEFSIEFDGQRFATTIAKAVRDDLLYQMDSDLTVGSAEPDGDFGIRLGGEVHAVIIPTSKPLVERIAAFETAIDELTITIESGASLTRVAHCISWNDALDALREKLKPTPRGEGAA